MLTETRWNLGRLSTNSRETKESKGCWFMTSRLNYIDEERDTDKISKYVMMQGKNVTSLYVY